jgi:ATP-dependent helicase/nuclease subunit B
VPYSIADWRIAAVAKAVSDDRDTRLLAGLLANQTTQPLAHAIDAGLRIVHARARGDYFGTSEGILASPAIAARLKERFGSKHSWSPSQFETYAACPYKFFLEDVLQLEPLGDIALETDHARRGSLLHQVLTAFHRKYGDKESDWAALARDEARFAAELLQELETAVAANPSEGIEAALTELDKRQIAKWTDAYYGQHEKYDKTWDKLTEPPRPAHFELRFGRKHPGEATDEDAGSVDDAFKLKIGDEEISIAGRIDRIDVGRDGDQEIFNVIDFKSGKRPTLTRDRIESGERLQPALYVMAAQALVFEKNKAEPLWAGYWSMQGGVTTQKKYSLHCTTDPEKPGESWDDLKASVIARIAEIVHDTRAGTFPVKSLDQHCTRNCEFKTVCRIGQARIAEKVVKSEEGGC